METIQITSEDGEQIQFYVVEQTRVNGKDYILVTETEDEEAEAYILKMYRQTKKLKQYMNSSRKRTSLMHWLRFFQSWSMTRI